MPQFPQDPRVPAAERLARTARDKADTNEASIASINPQVSILTSQVSTLETDLLAAEGDITTLQGDVTTAQGDLTTAQSDITTLQGDLTTAQGDITTISGDVTAIEAAIDGELFGDRAAGGFPGSPTDGELAYSSTGEWAYWDNGRSRWLSLWKEDLSYADQVATASLNFLKLQAIPTSATFGHYWPFDVCITHGQAICANTTTAATLVLLSTSHPAGTAGMTFSSSNKAQVAGLNVLIPAGEVVSCITSGATAGATSAIWYARRVFTS